MLDLNKKIELSKPCKMHTWFSCVIPLLFNIFANHCYAISIAEKECPTFNNSKNFGPLRDQDDRGFCHAFAAAGLFEEANCKKNKKSCGSNISPLSIARWTTNIMAQSPREDGWFADDDILAGLNLGVCNEKEYSFVQYTQTLNGTYRCNIRKDLSAENQARQMRSFFVQAASKSCDAKIIKFPGLTVQSDRYKKNLESCSGGHALIVQGIRWANGRCILDLRNSWGEGAAYQGEYDAVTFIGGLKGLASLKLLNKGEKVDFTKGVQATEHYNETPDQQDVAAFNNIRDTLQSGRSLVASVCTEMLPARQKPTTKPSQNRENNNSFLDGMKEKCQQLIKKFGKIDTSKIYNHTVEEVEKSYPGITKIMNGAVFDARKCGE